MTTQDALLADILAKPDDDLPRLVFADYLEENGDDGWAEFIRIQCRDGYAPDWADGQPRTRTGDGSYFTTREQLLHRHLMPGLRVVGWDKGRVVCYTPATLWPTVARIDVLFTRGFISEVRCRLIDWCGDECHQCAGTGRSFPIDGPSIPCRRCGGSLVTGIGPEVVRRHPVEKVTLTDRQPGERNSLWFWYFDSGESGLPSLPTTLNGGRQEQRCYESERDAVEDASRRVIAWAKSQVASEAAVV